MPTKVEHIGILLGRRTGKLFTYLFLIFLALVCFMPFYMMIINATHSNVEINQSLWIVPGRFLGDNYQIIQTMVDIWVGFANSLVITLPSVAFSAFFSSLTAYGFSKFRFRLRGTLFWVLLASMMIPSQLGIIGFFQLCLKMNLVDTFWPLIVPGFANASMVFFLKGYMDSAIPNELIEAAHMDGARERYIFLRIVLPLSVPSIATMSIFGFIGTWNGFLMPLLILNSKQLYPLPLVISMLKPLYGTNYGAIYLGVAISIVPIIVVFLFCSRFIIGGITVGAVKG